MNEDQYNSESKFNLIKIKSVLDKFFDKQIAAISKMFAGKNEPEAREAHSTVSGEIERMSPILEQAGYLVRESRISVGLPPYVELYLYQSDKHTKKSIEQLMDENKGDKSSLLILSALKNADKFRDKEVIGNQQFEEIILTLGIPPRVSLRYLHEDFSTDALL